MTDGDIDSYLRVPIIDQFMRPYQEEADVRHALAWLSEVINDARDPLRSDDTSNIARAHSQSAAPRPQQRGPSEQSEHDDSKIASGFQSDERLNSKRALVQDHTRDKRRSRRGEEDDKFHTRSTESIKQQTAATMLWSR